MQLFFYLTNEAAIVIINYFQGKGGFIILRLAKLRPSLKTYKCIVQQETYKCIVQQE